MNKEHITHQIIGSAYTVFNTLLDRINRINRMIKTCFLWPDASKKGSIAFGKEIRVDSWSYGDRIKETLHGN
jgi:hypothetical protein